MGQNIRYLVTKFIRSTEGGVAVIAAFSLVPLLIACGVALDFSRYSLVKNRLSIAADAAAIAGLKYESNSSADTVAKSFFHANYPENIFGVSPSVKVTRFTEPDRLLVTVNATVPAVFVKFIGVSSMPLLINAQSKKIVYGQTGGTLPGDYDFDSEYLPIISEGVTETVEYVNNLHIPRLVLQEDYTVKVTFVLEQAGYRNTLGYYTINTNTGVFTNPKIIFANASAQNSGGSLVPGVTTVTLGTFAKGTEFGFFIVSDGYSNNNFTSSGSTNYINLNTGSFILGYPTVSKPTLATQISAAKITSQTPPHLYYNKGNGSIFEIKSTQGTYQGIFHSVASPALGTVNLNDSKRQQIVGYGNVKGILRVGFEDTNLRTQSVDGDFNDVVIDVDLGYKTTSYYFDKTRVILTDPSQN